MNEMSEMTSMALQMMMPGLDYAEYEKGQVDLKYDLIRDFHDEAQFLHISH